MYLCVSLSLFRCILLLLLLSSFSPHTVNSEACQNDGEEEEAEEEEEDEEDEDERV